MRRRRRCVEHEGGGSAIRTGQSRLVSHQGERLATHLLSLMQALQVVLLLVHTLARVVGARIALLEVCEREDVQATGRHGWSARRISESLTQPSSRPSVA